MTPRPRIVCISGSPCSPSRVERLAAACGRECSENGAHVQEFHGPDLVFPFYSPWVPERDAATQLFIDAIDECDGVILASPAYHGSLSGLLKNALDYVNDLAGKPRPLLDGLPIACLAVGSGEQGTVTTLAALRTIAHALRGWPTPLGIAVTVGRMPDHGEDGIDDMRVEAQIRTVASQVMTLAMVRARRGQLRAERIAH